MYLVGKCRLKFLLNQRGMSQSDLARKMNLTPQQIYSYSSTKRIMSMQVAKNISQILNCSIDDLYEWEFQDISE